MLGGVVRTSTSARWHSAGGTAQGCAAQFRMVSCTPSVSSLHPQSIPPQVGKEKKTRRKKKKKKIDALLQMFYDFNPLSLLFSLVINCIALSWFGVIQL